MKHWSLTFCLVIAALFGSVGVGFASNLPLCPTDQSQKFHNCFGSFTTESGENYTDEWKDNQRHGQGKTTLANGERYEGEWKGDERQGLGTSTFPSGEKYVGEFKNDKKHGRGFYVFANGDADFCKYIEGKGSTCNGSSIHDITPNLKIKFYALSAFHRKQVQINLLKKGFYDSTIDGKWGRGTFTALASYSILNLKTVMINNSMTAQKLLNSVLNISVQSNNNEISSLPLCSSSADEVWNNCFGLYRLSDGDIYVGERKDDEKHGQGTYTYLQGGKYVGGWKKTKSMGKVLLLSLMVINTSACSRKVNSTGKEAYQF